MIQFSVDLFRQKLVNAGLNLPDKVAQVFSDATNGEVSFEAFRSHLDKVFLARFEQFQFGLSKSGPDYAPLIDPRPFEKLREHTAHYTDKEKFDLIYSRVNSAQTQEATGIGLEDSSPFEDSIFFEDYCHSVIERFGFQVGRGRDSRRPVYAKKSELTGLTARIKVGRGIRIPNTLPSQFATYFEMTIGRKRSKDLDWEVMPNSLLSNFHFYGAYFQPQSIVGGQTAFGYASPLSQDSILIKKLGAYAQVSFLNELLLEFDQSTAISS